MSRIRGERAKLQRPAFILNTRAIGIGASRSLAMKGVPVVAVDFRPEAAKLRSNSFTAYHQIPDIEKSPDAAVESLIQAQEPYAEKGVIFPTSDAFVLFVSRHRKELGKHFEIALPSEEVLEGMINKKFQYDIAAQLGVTIPDTYFPSSMEEISSLKNDISYPALIKPYYSHLWQPIFDNKGFQVFTPEELMAQFRKVLSAGVEAMVQSVIQGPNPNLISVRAYFDKNGVPHGVMEAQKVRQYPVDFGVGCLTQTVHCEEVRKMGLKFMQALGYRGVGYVEFKKDDRDGEYKMIELNARVGKTIGLSTRAGINLPWMMYQDLSGGQIDEVHDYPDKVRWHDFVHDCRAYMTLRSRGDITFKEWMRTSLGSECHCYFAWNDLKPVMVESKYGYSSVKELFYVALYSVGKSFKGSRSNQN